MKNSLTFFLLLSGLFHLAAQTTINAALDFGDTHPISPLIYGFNQDHESPAGVENWTIRRLGGNRMSVFNWENGASNSGHDNQTYPNDNRIPNLIGVPSADKDVPGEAYRVFHQDNLNAGITSLITVPILGWVAADKDGSNLTSPPSSRWHDLVYEKPTAFSLPPDGNDAVVYLDESIHYLVQTFGDATTANGVKYIALDNEPALWETTHDLLVSAPPNAADYVQKVIDAAIAVKSVDPNIKIVAGEFAGINIFDFGNAPDWGTVGNGYDWFISYFLDELKTASDNAGYPLIDILSFHNYPQHKIDSNGNFDGNGTVVRTSSSTQDHIRSARMDFPRSLWDPAYIEPSWLTNAKLGGQAMQTLVRVQNSIDTYFPGVKIMIGEFDYGHDTDISHGIGIADFLGVVADQGVEITNRWDLAPGSTNTYTSTAYQLFRNYDGSDASYGDLSVGSTFDQADNGSVWAAVDSDDDDLHLILVNKQINSSLTVQLSLNDNGYVHAFKDLRMLNSQSTSLSAGSASDISLSSGTLTTTLPALSVYHLVLNRTSSGPSQYTITTSVQGQGTVSLSPAGGIYDAGTQVTITATPATNYQFDDWSGDVSGSGNPLVVTLNGDLSVQANFSETTTSPPPCSNAIPISVPFSHTGSGNYCWVTSDDIFKVNSWNTIKLLINGVDYTNTWSNQMPPRINGQYYISFKGNKNWSHFEAHLSSNLVRGEDPALPETGQTDFGVSAFPNPFVTHTQLQLSQPQLVQRIRIYDVLGRMLEDHRPPFSSQMTGVGEQLEKGIYYLKISGQQQEKTLMLHKQ
ncbi:glycoside hydrolase family 44 protein [Flavilitoribacter nigricans]|uniref:T9SS type A sorting domain-containing protein n=1 Tax=Flavilitoribacter nigricans (strain ATCC 23147 / DSM 23189 / NBRC 102662 / NCIMB 1420 / SS-2) TaxID=1122177 RepID=A0A2D0NFK3_FLAN2|nr:glycoside hydrolase family 44 protein [Flavilitoribacter nigricans]PHN06563.1 hypothetical protein CRP01_09670 [Flavilitoribacter nigricans DSM 23189 = NBRC 102662]